ncbi:hypothetical protein TARUN_3293 [Trichoderma arundinaceum]|uniref:Proteophosphoglycan ppg4 n=1 Tax=Trichoderma arundinaceum TaxID=490622 RepID=A0A395NSX6_TRIAR|nr:hypothetical protein TARUN_3293 [Trichoderma arundinaceum]
MPRPQNPTGAAASSSTRISESYLAASLPFSSRDSQHITSGGDATQEPYLERLYEPSRRLSRRESDYMRSPVLPESPVTNTRSHSLYANSTASNQIRRTSSVMHSDGERPLTRTQSWHGNRMERGRSMQSDLLQFYASQQLPRTSSEFLQELQAAAMNSQYDTPQNRRASSVAGASLPRTTSDLSFYAPVRRRSVVQTPGVATRPRREDRLSIPDRSSSRKSQPVFGNEPYTFKPSSKAPKHVSMPPMPMGFGPLERAVTPCESDYKQLGGIKFGSLKIMNGSPPSSPQDKVKQQRFESSAGSSSEVVPDDSGIELNMARRKNRHTIIGSGAESRALASVSTFNFGERTSQPSNQKAQLIDDLVSSPLSKVPSPLLGYPDVEESEGASSKGMGGVRRSNSGFGSTTSSESSQRTSSKTDSGYSSNASERSFLSSKTVDDNSYIRQQQTRRRTLEQPTMTPMTTADGIKKNSRLYKPFVRLERNSAMADNAAKEAIVSSSAFMRPRVKRHEKHRYPASSSCLSSHKMDASSATLNTIMSVDNLVPSDTTPSSHSVSETEAGKEGPKPLKKRRSLRKVAEAATSRMPSLSLSRRRSAAGDVPSSGKVDSEKRKRAISLVNGNAYAAASNNSPYSHAMSAATASQPPISSHQQAKATSLKDRASAPDLRVAIPDQASLNRGAANRSSYSTLGTPSPRTPRFRGVMDPGVPPPIPPQFRAPVFATPPSNSPSWPLTQPHGSWDGAQGRRESAGTGQSIRRSPAAHHGLLDSPVSPRYSQPTRSNAPTYRGVRI